MVLLGMSSEVGSYNSDWVNRDKKGSKASENYDRCQRVSITIDMNSLLIFKLPLNPLNTVQHRTSGVLFLIELPLSPRAAGVCRWNSSAICQHQSKCCLSMLGVPTSSKYSTGTVVHKSSRSKYIVGTYCNLGCT